MPQSSGGRVPEAGVGERHRPSTTEGCVECHRRWRRCASFETLRQGARTRAERDARRIAAEAITSRARLRRARHHRTPSSRARCHTPHWVGISHGLGDALITHFDRDLGRSDEPIAVKIRRSSGLVDPRVLDLRAKGPSIDPTRRPKHGFVFVELGPHEHPDAAEEIARREMRARRCSRAGATRSTPARRSRG